MKIFNNEQTQTHVSNVNVTYVPIADSDCEMRILQDKYFDHTCL